MKKIKALTIVWGLIMIAIVTLLTIFGFIYKNKVKPYHNLEKNMVTKAQKYKDVTEYNLNHGETYKIDGELLEIELNVDDDKCAGYVIVKNEEIFSYKSYIKCEKYTTKGYK